MFNFLFEKKLNLLKLDDIKLQLYDNDISIIEKQLLNIINLKWSNSFKLKYPNNNINIVIEIHKKCSMALSFKLKKEIIKSYSEYNLSVRVLHDRLLIYDNIDYHSEIVNYIENEYKYKKYKIYQHDYGNIWNNLYNYSTRDILTCTVLYSKYLELIKIKYPLYIFYILNNIIYINNYSFLYDRSNNSQYFRSYIKQLNEQYKLKYGMLTCIQLLYSRKYDPAGINPYLFLQYNK